MQNVHIHLCVTAEARGNRIQQLKRMVVFKIVKMDKLQ
jgi:hypothetical protein